MFLVVVNLENPREMVATQASTGEIFRIGRKPRIEKDEEAKAVRITWQDRLVSRSHCEAQYDGLAMVLTRLPAVKGRNKPNALYTNVPPRGRKSLDEPVTLQLGESIAIGAKGVTAVYWLKHLSDLDRKVTEYFNALEQEKGEYVESRTANQNYDDVEKLDEYSLRFQLKMLQKELPEQVLSGWTDDVDLLTRAAVFLEGALPGQKGVTAVFIALERDEEGNLKSEILNPDPLARADFRPSKTLLSRIDFENAKAADIHLWTSKQNQRTFAAESLHESIDWVAAVPVARMEESAPIHRDDNGRAVFLYVQTTQGSETAGSSFIPFLRLISSLVASLLSARADQKLQDQMAAYFSPGLRKIMRESDPEVLKPAMVDCTVMFADRRGHSRMLEVAKSDDEILERLDDNQRVVGLITEEVFRSHGVITDFAGDGALGLWGWPSLVDSDQVHALEAVEAAEAIVERLAHHVVFEEEIGRSMAAVRIGISSGRIAVGKTGPTQQWHISVFGSVANLGARLERIAKEFKIPVLISDDTYCRIEGFGNRRFRRLCLIRPAGFEEGYPVYELVLPKSVGGSGISDQDIQTYEKALAFFHNREWEDAIDLLDILSEDDPPSLWLKEKAQIFRKNPPPESWAGEIASLSK